VAGSSGTSSSVPLFSRSRLHPAVDQHQGTIDVRPSGGAYACHSPRLIVGDGRVIENRTIVVDGVKIAQVGAAAAFAHRDFRKQILNVRSDEVLRVAP